MQEEIDKLELREVWDLKGVRQWADVSADAKRRHEKTHLGIVLGICLEEGSELPKNHPDRKFKGRYAYQGNKVIDEYNEAALFNELGSSPATLEGSKAVDAYGRLPGHTIEQADASAAYTQALMGTSTPGKGSGALTDNNQVTTTTWVRLPNEARPKLHNGTDKWWAEGIRDPVVPMQKAVYGHPDAGGYWEKHCEAHLRKCGFVLV